MRAGWCNETQEQDKTAPERIRGVGISQRDMRARKELLDGVGRGRVEIRRGGRGVLVRPAGMCAVLPARRRARSSLNSALSDPPGLVFVIDRLSGVEGCSNSEVRGCLGTLTDGNVGPGAPSVMMLLCMRARKTNRFLGVSAILD